MAESVAVYVRLRSHHNSTVAVGADCNVAVAIAPKMLPIVAQSTDEFKCGLRIHAVNDEPILKHSCFDGG